MSPATFTALSARTIHRGLFPRVQYGDGATWNSEEGGPAARLIAEERYNRPYVALDEGEDYAAYLARKQPLSAPRPGDTARPDVAVNRYLDCYIAPVGPDRDGLAEGGDYDLEGRLLRAHVLLTMLASYGTELVSTHSGKRAPEHAARLLGHIRDAELSLRSASLVTNDALLAVATQRNRAQVTAKTLLAVQDRAGATTQRRWDGYATRLLRTFQIAVDIQVIDAHQSFDRATNILSALSAPTSAAVTGVVMDAVKGLATVQKVQIYGDAMRRDAAETLAAHRLQIVAGPPLNGITATWTLDREAALLRWQTWDTALDRSCRLLAALAKQTDAGCIPTPAALRKVLETEGPLVPPAPPAGAGA